MIRGTILIFLTALLSGCTTHSIVKSSSKEDSTCKLVNAELRTLNSPKETLRISTKTINLGIKKLDSENLKIWLKFTPRSSKEDPLKNSNMILRSYKKGNIFQEYKMKGNLYSGGNALAPDKSHKVKDIWSKSEIYTIPILRQILNEKALEFIVSTEQFNTILDADETKILIETHYEPLIVLIEKEDLIPLKEFKQECLSK